MESKKKDKKAAFIPQGQEQEPLRAKQPDLKDPEVVLSLLEADQVVAAKQGTRFGRRELSFKVRLMLWGLRIYVAIMLVIVAVSIFRALHAH
ncbi:MAG TPA: hypothetical protein VGR93_12010 [Candidatus Acidoferrales bacterium]|nr:hypothetical protein [Candidatus Acidoferrales bacterium]